MDALRQLFLLIKALPPVFRRQLWVLQILTVVAAGFELAGVGAVMPFIMLVSNPQKILAQPQAAQVFAFFGCTDRVSVIWLAGIVTAAFFLLINVGRLLLRRHTLLIAARIEAYLSRLLFRHYLGRDFLFHAASNSAHLRERVTGELRRVCRSVQYLLLLSSGACVAAAVAGLLVLVDPLVSAGCALALAAAYAGAYRVMRPRLVRESRELTAGAMDASRIAGEGFGAFTEVKIMGREDLFAERMLTARTRSATADAMANYYSMCPRYLIEAAAFVLIIGVILLSCGRDDFNDVLPQLSLFAMGAFRLLPATQTVFGNFALIKGDSAAVSGMRDDILAALRDPAAAEDAGLRHAEMADTEDDGPLLRRELRFDNVGFRYPGTRGVALAAAQLTIPARATIGFAGSSGAGKSTAALLLLGLLTPETGSIRLDNQELTGALLRRWQRRIGYVPQQIFLADTSIAENIAFGAAVDPARLTAAAERAEIADFLSTLPQGYDTPCGERGIQLSGGQRQRIGIARALYHNPEVVVFDEATSALDGLTEGAVMGALRRLGREKTVVLIAHRLTTLRDCDAIYFFEQGRVSDRGTYQELLARNAAFREMAQPARAQGAEG